MAPEQAEGRLDRIGRRTDIYGLGAILYEILSGQPPFDGQSTEDVLRKVREDPPEPPRRINRKCPKALEAICLKAMSKDPDDRYGSAALVASDVQHWLADEPVSAYHEPWTTRAVRWVSHHRTPVAAGLTALVVTTAALAALLVAQTRSNQALEVALVNESKSRDKSDAHYALAKEAIESYYSGISEDVILRRPELESLRKRLLSTSQTFYERLAKDLEGQEGGQIHPLHVRDFTMCLERLASLQALTGARDQAIETRQKIVKLYDSVPGSDLGQTVAANRELANLQRLAGRPDDALQSFHKTLDRFGPRTGRPIELPEARVLVDLGLLQKDLGRMKEARQSLETALQIYQEILRADPQSRVSENIAAASVALGNLASEEGREDEALKFHQEALRLYESLDARQPKTSTYTYYKAELARSLNNVGLCLARLGQFDEARRTLERGRSIREALLADQALNIERRADLARSEYHFARLEARAAQPAEALKHLARAEELYTGVPPKAPEDWCNKACLLALRAQLVGAGKAEADLTPEERAERRRASDLAVERLKEAIGHGFRNVSAMNQDETLDSLRVRPDFQALLRSLVRPAP
jgi:serine/threonine-protein kinase